MKKTQKQKTERPILSFRTDEATKKLIDKEAKKQKLTRAEFINIAVVAAIQNQNSQTV